MLSCSHCWVLDSGVKQVLATPEQSTATVTVLDQGTDLDQTQFHPFLNSCESTIQDKRCMLLLMCDI